MAKRFAIQVSKAKKIVFRNQRHAPACFRFDVLMMHPDMDKDKTCPVEFRKSMKKFTTTLDHSFSVVGHSKPYSFGWFNNEVIVLLSSLGITDENLVTKQREYLRWIEEASTDTYKLAERVLLDGLEDEAISRGIRKGCRSS